MNPYRETEGSYPFPPTPLFKLIVWFLKGKAFMFLWRRLKTTERYRTVVWYIETLLPPAIVGLTFFTVILVSCLRASSEEERIRQTDVVFRSAQKTNLELLWWWDHGNDLQRHHICDILNPNGDDAMEFISYDPKIKVSKCADSKGRIKEVLCRDCK